MQSFIDPMSWKEFYETYWEKEPLVLHRNDSNYYQQETSIESILSQNRESKIVATKKGIPPNVNPKIDDFHLGFTIIVMGVERSYLGLNQFGDELAQHVGQLNCVYNLFITPSWSQGFQAHWDDFDVFALQLYGSKTWKLYKPQQELPLKESSPNKELEDLKLDSVNILHSGDLLYFPRGWIHEAFTTDEPSVHITIGVQIQKWENVILDAVVMATLNDIELRKAVPFHLSQDQLVDQLKVNVKRLIHNNCWPSVLMAAKDKRIV